MRVLDRLRRRSPAEAMVARLAGSPLFDRNYYLINQIDVFQLGVEPVRHFCDHGWREGRRPNLYFDPLWYADVYLAGAPAENPLDHYIRRGERAGCRPIAFFDPAWYRAAYALPPRVSPLAHFLSHRRSQRFAPNGEFDLAFYLARHGEEIGPNRDPFMHLLRCGAVRDLDPSPAFSSAVYRAAHMASAHEPAPTIGAHEMRVPLIHALDARVRAARRGAGMMSIGIQLKV